MAYQKDEFLGLRADDPHENVAGLVEQGLGTLLFVTAPFPNLDGHDHGPLISFGREGTHGDPNVFLEPGFLAMQSCISVRISALCS